MVSKTFNGNRLQEARKFNGLTVTELAKTLNVTKQTISQYENNKITPPFENIVKISSELKFPSEYFFQDDSSDVHPGTTYFRSLMKTKKKYRTEQVVKINNIAKIYNDFLKNYVEFPSLNLPFNKEFQTPIDAARFLRNYWSLGNEPVENMTRLLEENGIIITEYNTKTDDIDAFSQFEKTNDEDFFIIAVSKNKKSGVRRRFDLAHELGHILLHDWSEDIEAVTRSEFKEKEKEANEFASTFLLPEEGFKSELSFNPTDLDYYVFLKRKWKVSVSCMIMRARKFNLINNNQYQYLFRKMSAKGWRKKEPLDNIIDIEEPTLFKDSVDLLFSDAELNSEKFMKLLSEEASLAMESHIVEKLLNLPDGFLKMNEKKKSKEKIINLTEKALKI